MSEIEHIEAVRDEWGDILPDFVDAVRQALSQDDAKAARSKVKDLHAADLADLIEFLAQADRVRLIAALGKAFDVEALAELDSGVRDELIDALDSDTIASAIKKLDTDDAVYLIEELDRDERAEILSKISKQDRATLARALDYSDGTAGRLMQTEYVSVQQDWTVLKVLDHARHGRGLPENFVEVYVVDEGNHLIGAVPLSRLLRANRDKKISAIMDEDQTVFRVTDDEHDVAYKFEQYNLVSAAVTDESGKLVGMVMVDDILDVIQEAASEDILHLGGVGAEDSVADSVWDTTRSRFLWLFVNLLTAIAASWVISWFDATIEQMVALAILMPIVASMGGNAGTQTMTVAVRALATHQLGPVNALKVTLRECSVGLLNGLVFAVLIGLFAWGWFGLGGLGLVIAAAMIINLLAAALAGILVPLTLDHFEIDPAIASGAFVTTVTDVVGFFSFLGLAAVWLT
jgi:magnesium transporter